MAFSSPPNFHEVGAIKTTPNYTKPTPKPVPKFKVASASKTKPTAKKRPRKSDTQPPRKKFKFEILDESSDSNASVQASIAAPSSPISIDYESDSEDDIYDIHSTVRIINKLLKTSGRIQVHRIQEHMAMIEAQAQLQDKEMQKLAKNVEKFKNLSKQREGQMDKMSTYMWPKQIMDMHEDYSWEKVKAKMLKRQEERDAKFEKRLKAGLVSMPEKAQRPPSQIANEFGIWEKDGKQKGVMKSWFLEF